VSSGLVSWGAADRRSRTAPLKNTIQARRRGYQRTLRSAGWFQEGEAHLCRTRVASRVYVAGRPRTEPVIRH
jgi:hypothetical protein